MLIYSLSKFGGNRTNSLCPRFRFLKREKIDSRKHRPLNMSIRRVIFTSGQNLKPPFLCQYLNFFIDFFLTLEISFGSLLEPKNQNLKKIADLKVYGHALVNARYWKTFFFWDVDEQTTKESQTLRKNITSSHIIW